MNPWVTDASRSAGEFAPFAGVTRTNRGGSGRGLGHCDTSLREMNAKRFTSRPLGNVCASSTLDVGVLGAALRGLGDRANTARAFALWEDPTRESSVEDSARGDAAGSGSSSEAEDCDTSKRGLDDCGRSLDPLTRDACSSATTGGVTVASLSGAATDGALSATGARWPARTSPRARAAASVWASIDEYAFVRTVAALPESIEDPLPSAAVSLVSVGATSCFAAFGERTLGCWLVAITADVPGRASGCCSLARTVAVAGSASGRESFA